MNAWQWILVLWPVYRMGQGIAKDCKLDDKGKMSSEVMGRVIADILILIMIEFIMYKAGVLKVI